MAVEKEKKSCGQVMHECKEFVWNPRTHQFMGRTGSSWALILLFYLIFYAFLTALFCLTMWVLLQTVDPFLPKYQDRLSIPAYNDSRQAAMNEFCQPGRYNEQPDNGVLNYPKRACQFNRTFLRDCSGLNDSTYGYQEGRPCILVKMNRKEEEMQKLGEIAMFPAEGNIDLMYFPYYGKKIHVNYTQPVVAVKFLNLTFNHEHNVECKINAANIKTDERDKFAGRVAFKIRVNKK
ncbi:hypothetical protein Chor_013602 [Crotalus horridus]